MQMNSEPPGRLKQKQTRPSKSAKSGGPNFKQFLSNLVSRRRLVTFFSSQGPHYPPSEARFQNGSSVTKEKENLDRRVIG